MKKSVAKKSDEEVKPKGIQSRSKVPEQQSAATSQVWKPGDRKANDAPVKSRRSRSRAASSSEADSSGRSEQPRRRRRSPPKDSERTPDANDPQSNTASPDQPRRRRRRSPRSDRPEGDQSTQGGRSPQESGEDRPPAKRRRRRRSSGARGQNASAEMAGAENPQQPAVAASSPEPMREFKPKNISGFDGQSAYEDMNIPEEIKRALREMHFTVTTPIQAQLLPLALAGGDAAGKAQTGTGKTAAFLISMFTRFLRHPLPGDRQNGVPRALVLAPTRELALQIQRDALDIGRYAGITSVAVYGGMDFNKQQRELERPVDLIVATPGRLMDFASRKVIDLKHVEVLVIDEADRMLDMGFIPDVRKIVRMTPHPGKRQTLLFSATLTPNIVRLAEQWTRRAETIEIEPESVAAESVQQRVIITTQEEKFTLLYNLLQTENPDRVLIFSNRRDQAEMLHQHLNSYGFETALLSGAVDQRKRVRVLEDFTSGKVKVLVATDVAGRGLHVEGISHVINYHMPMDPDDYVHRIGRTGRAGEIGTSISFACELDSFEIPNVEEYIGRPLVCEHPSEELLKPIPPPNYKVESRPRRSGGGRQGGSDSRGGRSRNSRRSGSGGGRSSSRR